jgi:3-oxoacyl-[acyl-carrier protein] reductase
MTPASRYAGGRALVVGASGGIGGALAEELVEGGSDLAVTYRRNPGALDRLAERAAELGRRCLVYRLDLRDAEAVACVCGRLLDELGTPTVVVSSAGVVRDRPLAEMEPGDWLEMIETNLSGPFRVLRQVVPAMMRNGGGRILNLASVSGLYGQPGQAGYAASKGGLIAMTRALARELGPFGITVNALAPGVVETEMTGHLSESLRRRFLERIPLRRFAEAADLVPAARLLMAPEGGYVTGQVLIVDGGMSA